MNSLYIHVSNAVTLAATCDDTLLAYVTLDYTTSLLQDIYAKFNSVHYDVAIAVFDGRIAHKQLDGCVSTFNVVYSDKLQKVYGNVSSDDIINLYTLLKYMEIPEVYMYDNSVSVLSIAGAVPCIFKSYDCYILFDSTDSPAISYIDKDKVAVTLGELAMQGKTPIVFDKLPCSDVKAKFKENFLTNAQRQKLHYFCYAMQQDPAHRIKVHDNSETVVSMPIADQPAQVATKPVGLTTEIVAESASVTISSTAFITSANNGETAGRFRYIPLEKIDIYDIPDYCCLEMNVALLMAILSSGEFEQEEVRERIRPLVRVNLSEYNKVVEEQGDVLGLYEISDSFLDPRTDYDPIIISPTNTCDEGGEISEDECATPDGVNLAEEQDNCGTVDEQVVAESDTSNADDPEESAQPSNTTPPKDVISFLDPSLLQDAEITSNSDEDKSNKSAQINTEDVATGKETVADENAMEDAGFSSFLQSLKQGSSNNDVSDNTETVSQDSIALRARNRKLRGISINTDTLQESDVLRIYGENPDILPNEHFALEDAVRFNRVADEVKKSDRSNVSLVLLSIFNLILALALVFSFLSKDAVHKEYSEEELSIIGSYKVLTFFTDTLDSVLGGSSNRAIDEIDFIKEYATIEKLCVHENWAQDNVYCVKLNNGVTAADLLQGVQERFSNAKVESIENTDLQMITITH